MAAQHSQKVALHIIVIGLALKGVYGCKSGWIQHDSVCYHFSHDVENWASAETMCRLMGGTLASIFSEAENNFIMTEVKRLQASSDADDRYWIGASDLQVENEWRWMATSELISYSSWSPGQPDNAGDTENCVEFMWNGLWNDNRCVKQTHYICEEREGTIEVIG